MLPYLKLFCTFFLICICHSALKNRVDAIEKDLFLLALKKTGLGSVRSKEKLKNKNENRFIIPFQEISEILWQYPSVSVNRLHMADSAATTNLQIIGCRNQIRPNKNHHV